MTTHAPTNHPSYQKMNERIFARAIQSQKAGKILELLSDLSESTLNVQDQAGSTPLNLIVKSWPESPAKDAVVSGLLDAGAVPDMPNKLGQTPLYWAARMGDLSSADLLLSHGADPNRQNFQGSTPLHAAVLYAKRFVVERLIEHGADPRIVNRTGHTPAYLAEGCCNQEILRAIRQHLQDVDRMVA